MGDNILIGTRQAQGATQAADEIDGVLYPRVKLILGADGVNDGDVSASNPLHMASRGDDIAMGLDPTHTGFRKFGYNSELEVPLYVVCSLLDQTLPWMPLVAQEVEIVSASTTDKLGGLGAQKVAVVGLDENWDEQIVEVTMNGDVPVVLSGYDWRRIYRAYVTSMGTYRGSNVGIITISEAESPAASIIQIDATQGQTFTTHYCVPRNRVLLVKNWNLFGQAGKVLHFEFQVAPNANDLTVPYSGAVRTQLNLENDGEAMQGTFEVPFTAQAYTDMWAAASIASGDSSLFFEYSGCLVTM